MFILFSFFLKQSKSIFQSTELQDYEYHIDPLMYLVLFEFCIIAFEESSFLIVVYFCETLSTSMGMCINEGLIKELELLGATPSIFRSHTFLITSLASLSISVTILAWSLVVKCCHLARTTLESKNPYCIQGTQFDSTDIVTLISDLQRRVATKSFKDARVPLTDFLQLW